METNLKETPEEVADFKPQDFPTSVPEKKEESSTESDEVTTTEELVAYARNHAKPQYSPEYRKLLNDFGVAKFPDIPADKIAEAKQRLDEIFKNIV
jgi:hypothetical protein